MLSSAALQNQHSKVAASAKASPSNALASTETIATAGVVSDSDPMLIEKHRENFNGVVFPNGFDVFTNKGVHHSAERIATILKILHYWDSPRRNMFLNPDEVKLGYNVTGARGYVSKEEENVDGTKTTSLFRVSDRTSTLHGKESRPLRVVANEKIFDVIRSAHLDAGHLAAGSTWNLLKEKNIFSIVFRDVKAFIDTCPNCVAKPIKKAQPKGASKPIASGQFRDRFLADLKDMSSDPGLGYDGTVYNWLLTVKDHFTRFVFLAPLKTKSPDAVAEVISQYFGLVGYPLVFHTDNGLEFIAESIVSAVKELHPACVTVRGRVRTPRDQGSVERSHQTSAAILTALVADEKKRNPQSKKTWVQMCGPGMAAMNKTYCFGRRQIPPYTHVFAETFNIQTSVDDRTLRSAKTPAELCRLLGDDELMARLRDSGVDMDYNPATPNPESVTDTALNFLNSATSAPAAALAAIASNTVASPLLHSPASDTTSVLDSPASESGVPGPGLRGKRTLEVVHITPVRMAKRRPFLDGLKQALESSDSESDNSQQATPGPSVAPVAAPNVETTPNNNEGAAEQANLGSDSPVTTLAPVTTTNRELLERLRTRPVRKLVPGMCEISAMDAFEYVSKPVGQNRGKYIEQVHFDCEQCRASTAQLLIRQFSLFDSNYIKGMSNSNVWFNTSLCLAFVALTAHTHHLNNIVVTCCSYPETEPYVTINLPDTFEKILCICWAGHHFACMEIDIEQKVVRVDEGLRYQMRHWLPHATFVLRQYGLVEKSANKRIRASSISPFDLQSQETIRQTDSASCGPLALWNFWSNFPSFPGGTRDLKQIRKLVLQRMDYLFRTHSNHLVARVKLDKVSNPTHIIRYHESDRTIRAKLPHTDSQLADGCIICYSLFDGSEYFEAMPCGHIFHYECVEEYRLSQFGFTGVEEESTPSGKELGGCGLKCPTCRTGMINFSLQSSAISSLVLTKGNARRPLKFGGEGDGMLLCKPVASTPLKQTTIKELPQTLEKLKDRSAEKAKLTELGRERQQKQAGSMIKRFGEHHGNVELGNVVSVRVDKRSKQVQNPRPVIGVVSFIQKETYSIGVVTEQGLLGSQGRMSLIPPENYEIRNNATISQALETIQKSIIAGHKVKSKLVTQQAAHTSQNQNVVRNIVCKCRQMCRTQHCGCKKAEQKCTEKCGCKGNC